MSGLSGPNSGEASERVRLQVALRGAVQGVGFRPFLFRLATELGLTGWATNSVSGVRLEVEGDRSQLAMFLTRLSEERPTQSVVLGIETAWLRAVGYSAFEIRPSDPGGVKTGLVMPDLAVCFDCLQEIFDPGNRRFCYPFTNCTACGPRFTIIEALPYDRATTSMKSFVMCPECQAEYDEPSNRRFHAQPNACPACGPHLELWDGRGRTLAVGNEALDAAATALQRGALVAVKGLGGFHLMTAASQNESVQRLREVKHREEKPLAVMVGTLEQVWQECEVGAGEEILLRSPVAPIVLLRRRALSQASGTRICDGVAPRNPYLGVMLPSTPLHHLLLRAVEMPLVATSGNLAEEPICIDEADVTRRLEGMADFFLVHNRPIVRHADDSIVRVMAGREMVLRRARGYAPLPISIQPADAAKTLAARGASHSSGGQNPTLKSPKASVVLAVGAHLKNTVALAVEKKVFISQHVGDLETPQAYSAFENVIGDFERFYEVQPEWVAADAHPDYLSTRYASQLGRPILSVQHHYAHVLSCMAEHGLSDPVLGISWDGTGFGTDGTIWGGEFLLITPKSFERYAHLRTFRLPGGDKAVKEPRRCALGVLYELFGDAAFEQIDLLPIQTWSKVEKGTLRQMLGRQINSPLTSSAGRLFDAAASLLGLRQFNAFEGQAALELEFAVERFSKEELESGSSMNDVGLACKHAVPQIRAPRGGSIEGEARWQRGESKEQVEVSGKDQGAPVCLDWAPILHELLHDWRRGMDAGLVSMKFHNGLVAGMVEIARQSGQENVVLSGGCFQNKYLTERAVSQLRRAGFRPFWHRLVPPNDGGIALGQVVAVVRSWDE